MRSSSLLLNYEQRKTPVFIWGFHGAGDRTRTDDILLGKYRAALPLHHRRRHFQSKTLSKHGVFRNLRVPFLFAFPLHACRTREEVPVVRKTLALPFLMLYIQYVRSAVSSEYFGKVFRFYPSRPWLMTGGGWPATAGRRPHHLTSIPVIAGNGRLTEPEQLG